MKDYFNYKNKICVVTGAASGMGKATTEMLVDLGAKVYALDYNPCQVTGIEKFIQVNLGDKASIDAAFKEIPERINAYFGIAGVSGVKTNFETTVTIDLIANTYITEEYLQKRMQKDDAIAYITSTGGSAWKNKANQKYFLPVLNADSWENKISALKNLHLNQLPGGMGYFFAKMAMNYYVSKQIDVFGPKGIRINAVLPGSTATGMKDEFAKEAGGEKALISYTGYAQRLAKPEEMAAPIVFLNSDMASYISGELLNVDYGCLSEKENCFKPNQEITFDAILKR